jgi:L-lactate dehydrogenase complex protein LldE
VGEATVKVLRGLGVEIGFPEGQTCCGQPAYNAGYHREATEVARRFIDVFEGDGYVVVPSGSCAAMIKAHYPYLFRDDPDLLAKVEQLAQRTHELSGFLVNVMEASDTGGSFTGKVTYQQACHLLRDLGISSEPRVLIRGVRGAELSEMDQCDTCCGFGGLFSVKQPHISTAMLDDKLDAIVATGADLVVSNDMGCLMHLSGAISRRGLRVRTMHLAEFLAT